MAGLTRADPEQVAHRLVTFPVQDLLRLALTSGGSRYWVNLALCWAAQVDLAPALSGHVRDLALDATVPQSTRHRGKRLYYTGKCNALPSKEKHRIEILQKARFL